MSAYVVYVVSSIEDTKLNLELEFPSPPTFEELVKATEHAFSTELRSAPFKVVSYHLSRGGSWVEVAETTQIPHYGQLYCSPMGKAFRIEDTSFVPPARKPLAIVDASGGHVIIPSESLKDEAVPPTGCNGSTEPIAESSSQPSPPANGVCVSPQEYISRFAGKIGASRAKPPFADRLREGIISWIGAFLGIGALSVLHWEGEGAQGYFLIASFGASAVLIYAVPSAPLAQPWNFIVGHVVAAVVGVIFHLICDGVREAVVAPLACATAILVQHLLAAVHPPGGATAIIASVTPITSRWHGFFFVVSPVLAGVSILTVIGLLHNNLFRSRQYPQYWY